MTGRGLRGRRIAQAMLAMAVVPVAFVAVLYVMAPHSTGPMTMEQPSSLVWIVPAIGVAGIVLGFLWMVRIYRSAADPERHASRFRFRR
jgi:hypothetical protein